MSLALKIYQRSGVDVVDVLARMSDRRATVGRRFDECPSNHIVVKGAPHTISRRHFSLKYTNGTSEATLWARDGAMSAATWEPSNAGTWVDGKPLSSYNWTPLRLDTRLTFAPPGKDFTAGHRVSDFKIVVTSESGSHISTDGGTMALGAIQVWAASSMTSDLGVALLRELEHEPGRLLILKIDSTAESVLGYPPRELEQSEGQVLLNDLLLSDADKLRLIEQAQQSLRQNASTTGVYTGKGGEFALRLAQRYVEGETYLLAYIESLAPVVVEPVAVESWQAIGIKAWLDLAQKNPVLALAVLGAVVAISVLILGR
ncbi:MAG: FHA domain-containing protein [Cyanobacteria bacterium J06554_11]